MMIATLVFYLFAAVLIASAFMVVASRNPVHAVLFLVLCFFNAAGLFVLLGAEFIAFILVIVYVGAVAVLFLFVVMMLDIDFAALRGKVAGYLPLALGLGAVLLGELGLMIWTWSGDSSSVATLMPPETAQAVDNTRALGRVLYTDYFYPFQVAGLILLVAMIGAIVLTLRDRKTALRQDVTAQLDRRPEDVVEIVKVKSGEGVL